MILSVDVERDWGLETTKNFLFLSGLFNWLEDTKSSATLFVTGNVAEPLNEVGIPKQVEIASHTMTHPNLQKLSENDVINEIQESKATLETIFKTKVKGFRAPYFLAPPNLWEILGQSGYTYSSSLAIGWFPKRYKNKLKPTPHKKGNITELPVQKMRILPFAFGLPFMRLFWPLQKLFTPKNPYIFYYHPTELLSEKPGPAEGKYIGKVYGLHRGQRARRILYEFLEKQKPTTSIKNYLKNYERSLSELPTKKTKPLSDKVPVSKPPAKKELKTEEAPGDSGKRVTKTENIEVSGLKK